MPVRSPQDAAETPRRSEYGVKSETHEDSMKLETFDDVLNSIKVNKGRKFHLLLGNGFSMAYDSEIFSYNALHDFITKLDDEDLSKIFDIIETRNFELIMQQLDNLSALIGAFGGAIRN